MPFNYAHYRFACEQLKTVPFHVRSTVNKYRQLYDVGLHGPDIFMCGGSKLRRLSQMIHDQSGREFFPRVVRALRLEPSEKANAYLYGLLTHYCLDSCCHPFVNERAALGPAGHVEIESEFDRYLLELDGKVPTDSQDLSRHIRLDTEGCRVAARFYPPVTASQVGSCVSVMALFAKVLAIPKGPGRELMKKTLGITGEYLPRFFMTDGPNPRCAELNLPLMERYTQAQSRFEGMLRQLLAHMDHNAPLGAEFDGIFG